MKKIKLTIEATVTDQYFEDHIAKVMVVVQSGEHSETTLENVGVIEYEANFEDITDTIEKLKQD